VLRHVGRVILRNRIYSSIARIDFDCGFSTYSPPQFFFQWDVGVLFGGHGFVAFQVVDLIL
jgi:hypothetical protein